MVSVWYGVDFPHQGVSELFDTAPLRLSKVPMQLLLFSNTNVVVYRSECMFIKSEQFALVQSASVCMPSGGRAYMYVLEAMVL